MARARAEYEITARDRTAKAFTSVQGSLNKTAGLLGQLRGGLAGLGATIGVGGLSVLVAGSLAASDRLGKLAERLGVSTEFLSEMRFAAKQSGVEFDTFAAGLQRMIRRVSAASLGTGDAVGALAELGLEAKKLKDRGPEKAFLDIAKALEKVKGPLDRVRLAQKLFDSEGVALLQITNQGADGIGRLRKRARELGATLTKEQAKGAAEAQDALGELGTATEGLERTISSKLAPGIERAAGSMADFVAEVNRAVQSSDTLADSLRTLGTTGLSMGLGSLANVFRPFGDLPLGLGLLPGNLANMLGFGSRFLGGLGAAPAGAPVTIGPRAGGGRLVTGGEFRARPGQKGPDRDVLDRIAAEIVKQTETLQLWLRALVTNSGSARAG